VQATRTTMRAGLAELVQMQTKHELSEQAKLFTTADFREGVRAVADDERADLQGLDTPEAQERCLRSKEHNRADWRSTLR